MKDLSFLQDKLIAHRGAHGIYPENSMPAFKKALEKGYPIELDIQLLNDNEIVVFHDATLKRMCQINSKLSKYNLKELKNICLGDSKYHIPTLKEVLDLIKGKVPLIIEIKSDAESIILRKKLIEMLDKYSGKFCIQCFNPKVLRWFYKNKPEYIRGLLITNKKKSNAFYRGIAKFLSKPDFLSCSKYLANKKFIQKFNKKGIVLAWTINSKEELIKYQNKFDNFIVDYL